MSRKRVVIIGSGFSGLSAACFLAGQGHSVSVLEKHPIPGGRARQLHHRGFIFDMGPSWYWMPDVFDRFFSSFGKKTADYYSLRRLAPSYTVFWENQRFAVPADPAQLEAQFERWEPGSGKKFRHFMREAAYKYEKGMKKMAYRPGRSLSELIDPDMFAGIFRLDLFRSVRSHVGKHFNDPRIRQLLEFPVLFLGGLPQNIPALYTLMNYADIQLGTWYPGGGMYSVVRGMHQLARDLGVSFYFNEEVRQIAVKGRRAGSVQTASGDFEADIVVASADYHHVESKLIPTSSRSYSDRYWNSRVMAPSCLIYYVGLSKKIRDIPHHGLFFDAPFEEHAVSMFGKPAWPEAPLFYTSCTSATDPATAPQGCENLFILVPVASGLEGDSEPLREEYFNKVIERMERRLGQAIAKHILFSKSYAGTDFGRDYHAYRGNAYGLANTLTQTAHLKPRMRSKKVDNLFFTGQLTVPGPGVPPGIISGEVVSRLIAKTYS